jgi:hypothetical protein
MSTVAVTRSSFSVTVGDGSMITREATDKPVVRPFESADKVSGTGW